MMTIFSRKELISTFSMQQQANIRNILAANGIGYKVQTINRGSSSPFSGSRAWTGTLGQNMDLAYEYTIFVRKADYAVACRLISELPEIG